MKKIILGTLIATSMLSISAFADSGDLEANSLIVCNEGNTIAEAVSALNGTIASPFYNVRFDSRSFLRIKDYVSSQPTITKLDNGTVSVCVTLTRKK